MTMPNDPTYGDIAAALGTLSDSEFTAITAAETARRKVIANASGPLALETRIQMNANIRPTRIAGRTATITNISRSRSGEWTYSVQFDGTSETFVRVTRASMTVLDDTAAAIPAASKAARRTNHWG